MKMFAAVRDRHLLQLPCFWIISCVASFSIPPNPVSISSPVGSQAILPCTWKSQLDKVPICHVQWQTPDDTVFEQKGEIRWQANEFKGRVEVPEEKLEKGDCSLIVHDVQLGDVGLYESFMVVDSARMKRRVFIQSVLLSVYEYQSKLTLAVGEDLDLNLYTHKAVKLVFQVRNSTDLKVLWLRGEEFNKNRLEEAEGALRLRQLVMGDSGTYKVLDAQGLSVSTVELTVEEVHVTTSTHLYQIQDKQEPVGKSVVNSSSLLIIFLLQISLLLLK
ncbi:hypothetical protein UPYG_G00338880 [Umbra pygmaea]|uniref:Immunoglobulin V-set domain-containing protein n=1 Tax=Umbra pygmaea TaxID=75934 RepID=A0ABD0VWQ0_UMBPY